jgi:vacuolar-type H+-ATPase subunit H
MTEKRDRGRSAPETVEGIREGIENTRKEMTATLSALEGRLKPEALGEKANVELDHLEARLKRVMKEGIDEAKEAVTRGLKEARENVKADVDEAVAHAKSSVREATLGRIEHIATKAGDVMNDSRETLVETIRQNPIPAVLAGVGIAWLVMNRSSTARSRTRHTMNGNPYSGMSFGPDGPRSEYGSPRSGPRDVVAGFGRTVVEAEHSLADAAGTYASRAKEVARDAASHVSNVAQEAGAKVKHAVAQGVDAVDGLRHQATEAAGHAAHDARDRAAHLAHDAAEGAGQLVHRAHDAAYAAREAALEEAKRAEQGLTRTYEQNPLAFGIAAAVAGAALGYALPRTEQEDKLVGPVRDRAIHDVAELATDAVRSVQPVAEDAGKAAKGAVTTAVSH